MNHGPWSLPESQRQVIEWFKSHRSVFPLLVAGLVLLKVLRVSHGDLGTAALILSGNGIAGLTTLVMLSAGPWMLLMASLAAFWTFCALLFARQWRTPGWWMAFGLWAVSSLASLTIVPVVTLILGAVLGLACGLFVGLFYFGGWLGNFIKRSLSGEQTQGRGSEDKPKTWFTPAALACLGGIIGAAAFGLFDTMWLPAERITVGQQSPVAGYVLSDDGNHSVVLLDMDRSTVTYESGDIEDRRRCQPAWALEPGPLLPPWPYDRPPAYPDCPS